PKERWERSMVWLRPQTTEGKRQPIATLPPRGLRRHRATHRDRQQARLIRERFLAPRSERGRVWVATVTGSQTKGHGSGKGTGLAMKSGNADGVKVPTAIKLASEHRPSSVVESAMSQSEGRLGASHLK